MAINISNRRKELGLTLEDIAKIVGVSKSTVKKWESGYIKNMGRDKVVLLANALNISPIDLLEIKECSPHKNPSSLYFQAANSAEIKALLSNMFPNFSEDLCVLCFNENSIYCINSSSVCKKVFSLISSSD